MTISAKCTKNLACCFISLKKQYNRLVDKLKLSVVIHTKNAAETIEQTLRSVAFADELVVIDMHSADATVKLAKKYTRRIYFHEDVGYADPARNFGLKKASYPWIFVLDADETVTPELQEIILETLASPKADVYYLPRKNLVFGQWILRTGWWPDYQPRLFKKDTVSWQLGVHRLPDIKGTVEYFPAEERYAITHYNYGSIAQFIDRLNNYTTLQARERLAASPQDNFSAHELLEIFSGEFAKRGLTLDGIEDGLHGVSLSLLQAMYESVIYLKQWEAKGFSPVGTGDFSRVLSRVQQVWRYWWADYQVRHTTGLNQWHWRLRRKLMI